VVVDAADDRSSRTVSRTVSSRTVSGGERRRAAALAGLPDVIELIVVAVRAGCTPASAIGVIAPAAPGPLRPVLAEVEHRLHRGQRLADALTAITEALGPTAAGFVDALATCDRYGLALGPVLDRLADEIRIERRRQVERQARTLPVKLSFPLVVCTLPSFVLLAIVPAVLGAVSTLRGSAP
jgi:tight adherence protein C